MSFCVSGYFTFKMAAVFYRKGISNVFMHWSGYRTIEVYIIVSTSLFCRNYRTMIKSVAIEKSLENKAFWGFCILIKR